MSWSFIFVFIVSIIVSVASKQSDKFICGVKFKSSELSVNKTASEPNEWPWLASLHLLPSIKYFCGGTIVSEHHVLTAAHCVDNKLERLRLDQILVYLGRHNLSSMEEKFEWFIPYQLLVHPDWEVSGNRFDADIAVLIAAMPIPFSVLLSPICLWTDLSEDEDYVGTVVGWGEFGTRNVSDVPNQLRVHRTSSARCYEDFFQIAAIASSRTFCAGGNQENNVPCVAFSGGGFFVQENGVWYIQGIVSSTILTGSNRCNASKYSLFTKINEFITWINVRKFDHIVFFAAFTQQDLHNNREIVVVCQPKSLTVLQASGHVQTNENKLSYIVKFLIIDKQDIVYFPYGFGALYPNLTRLEVLESNLKFIDRKNFEEMRKVSILYIITNPISSIPHDAFFDLKNLAQLMIDGCKLTNLHPDLLSENKKLKFLSLERNQLESLPSNLLRNNFLLEAFYVSDNRIKSIDHQLFANLEYLETINFTQNSLQQIPGNAFRDLRRLKMISLDHNRLKNLHVDIISDNLNLERFDVKYNQIEVLEYGLFRSKTKLNWIIFDQNKVKHVDDKLYEDLTALETMYLNGMSISKLPANLFFNLTKLAVLEIQTNDLTKLDENLLCKNLQLFIFKADFNRIDGLHSNFFKNNLRLQDICLSNNRIKSLAKGLFNNLNVLDTVDLSFNYISSISGDIFEGVFVLLILNENSFNLNLQNMNSARALLPGAQMRFTSGAELSEMEKFGINYQRRKLREKKPQEKHQRTDPSTCGRKLKPSGLIVNGTASGVNEWPWLTSLVRAPSKNFFCGGSIVSEHHVLTAAHCLHDKHRGQAVLKPSEFLVYLGKHNLSALEENSQWFHPYEVLVHPEWTTDTVRYDADLAIVVSDLPIPFSSTIAPVCLWTELEEDGNYFGTVVGWGASEKTGLTSHTDVPYQVEVRRVPSAKCYEDQHLMAQIGSSRTFCARGIAEYSGPCNGDSGGGFFVELNGVWYLQGIVSYTMKSIITLCEVSKFAMFTKINEFLFWINLRNKAYDVRLRGHLEVSRKNENMIIFNINGLVVTQPSANVILDWKNSMLKVDRVVTSTQNVVYLPNHVGRIFPTLKQFEIKHSNLQFVERENFEEMKLLRSLTIQDNPIKNLPGDVFAELTGLLDLKITETRIVLLREDLFLHNFQLHHLNLSSNRIESLPPGLLRNQTELSNIDLSYNQVQFIKADDFENLGKLENINLENNRIQEISPQSLSTLKNLKVLQLESNRIKILHNDIFALNKELTLLSVANNLIEDFSPTLLNEHLKLEYLALRQNKIRQFSLTFVSNTYFQNLSRVKELDLNSMNIKVLPRDFFFALTGLQDLRLNGNHIEAFHKDMLSKNGALYRLSAAFNNVKELHPVYFQGNLKLQDLNLVGNQISFISSGLFKNLTDLHTLQLSLNLIEAIDVDSFSDLESLSYLFLSENKLKHLEENLFSNLTNLIYLDMSSNRIEHLSSELFRNNHALVSLAFSYNNLKTIEIEFNPYRVYQHLLFFGNICVNAGGLGEDLKRRKADVVEEVVTKCSVSNKVDLEEFRNIAEDKVLKDYLKRFSWL